MNWPDRIWAFDYDLPENDGTWRNWKCWSEALDEPLNDAAAEYVRRNPAVLAALPEVQELIAGAIEAVARVVVDNAGEFDHPSTHYTFGRLADKIRTLTPADAIVARDAMITAAVAKEREACAELAASSTVQSQTAMRLSAAIRKRGEGQP